MAIDNPIRPPAALVGRREAVRAGVARLMALPLFDAVAPPPPDDDDLVFRPWECLALAPAELQYLSAWQYEWAAKRPGPARRLMRLHGARIPQIRSLIRASAVDIGKRRCNSLLWPWPSPAQFRQRLDQVQRLLAGVFEVRPFHEGLLEDAPPFWPCEARFLVAWHQEWHDFAAARDERVCYYYKTDLPWPYSPAGEAVRRELGEAAEINLLPHLCQTLFDGLGVDPCLVSAAVLPKPHSLCDNLCAIAHERWYANRHGRSC